jgi:type VI secretion system protein ImpH
MAGTSGRSDIALIDLLFERPDRFEFVSAVRLLEQLDRRNRADRPPDLPSTDSTRFRAVPPLVFPGAEVAAIRGSEADQPAELDVCFLGLNGPSGVLPRFYSEWVVQQAKQKNIALRDFFDIFNDRAIRYHLAASRKYRMPAAFEISNGSRADPITTVLRAVVGMATAGLEGRLRLSDDVLLTYAGCLGRAVRSATGLEQILCDFLGRPVEVQQLTGRWAGLVAEDQTMLPTLEHRNGRYTRLGIDAVLGERIFDIQGAFRLRIGPLGLGEFTELLPGSPLVDEIADLTRFYVGPSLAFEIQLMLRQDSIPLCVLGGTDTSKPLLGLNSWLYQAEPLTDSSDVLLRFEKI